MRPPFCRGGAFRPDTAPFTVTWERIGEGDGTDTCSDRASSSLSFSHMDPEDYQPDSDEEEAMAREDAETALLREQAREVLRSHGRGAAACAQCNNPRLRRAHTCGRRVANKGGGHNNKRSHKKITGRAPFHGGGGGRFRHAHRKPIKRKKGKYLGNASVRSKFCGVFWSGKETAWMAQITYGGGPNHLGYYGTEEKAALVYDAAVREHHGPGRPVNFPLPGSGETKAKKRMLRDPTELALALADAASAKHDARSNGQTSRYTGPSTNLPTHTFALRSLRLLAFFYIFTDRSRLVYLVQGCTGTTATAGGAPRSAFKGSRKTWAATTPRPRPRARTTTPCANSASRAGTA